MNPSPMCCGKLSSWVENVPGKGYYYCRECKEEVCAKQAPTSIREYHDLSIHTGRCTACDFEPVTIYDLGSHCPGRPTASINQPLPTPIVYTPGKGYIAGPLSKGDYIVEFYQHGMKCTALSIAFQNPSLSLPLVSVVYVSTDNSYIVGSCHQDLCLIPPSTTTSIQLAMGAQHVMSQVTNSCSVCGATASSIANSGNPVCPGQKPTVAQQFTSKTPPPVTTFNNSGTIAKRSGYTFPLVIDLYLPINEKAFVDAVKAQINIAMQQMYENLLKLDYSYELANKGTQDPTANRISMKSNLDDDFDFDPGENE